VCDIGRVNGRKGTVGHAVRLGDNIESRREPRFEVRSRYGSIDVSNYICMKYTTLHTLGPGLEEGAVVAFLLMPVCITY